MGAESIPIFFVENFCGHKIGDVLSENNPRKEIADEPA